MCPQQCVLVYQDFNSDRFLLEQTTLESLSAFAGHERHNDFAVRVESVVSP